MYLFISEAQVSPVLRQHLTPSEDGGPQVEIRPYEEVTAFMEGFSSSQETNGNNGEGGKQSKNKATISFKWVEFDFSPF